MKKKKQKEKYVSSTVNYICKSYLVCNRDQSRFCLSSVSLCRQIVVQYRTKFGEEWVAPYGVGRLVKSYFID